MSARLDPRPPVTRPGIVALRVIGSVVAVLIVAGTAVSVVAGFFHQERSDRAVYRQALTRVAVDSSTGSITVRTGAQGSPVVVRRRLSWSFGSAGSAESATGGTLNVTARCTDQFGFGFCSVSYDVTVPPGVALALNSDTGSVLVDGPTGEVSAHTSTGSVEVRNARSGRVNAASSTGAVDLTLAVAPDDVRAETSTGAVDIAVPADGTAYDVVAYSSTGSRDVSVPVNSSSAHRIQVKTSTGDVSVRAAS